MEVNPQTMSRKRKKSSPAAESDYLVKYVEQTFDQMAARVIVALYNERNRMKLELKGRAQISKSKK